MNSKWPARFVRLPLLPLGCILILAGCGGGGGSGTPPPTPGATGLQRVNHIIVMMQENHSFDNYFGALPYAPGSPYHAGPCASTDNKCVDALTCTASGASLACTNSNPENDGAPPVVSFHDPLLCIPTDLDHSWVGTHQEINFLDPNNSLHGTNDGFVEDNDGTDAPDTGESATDDHTMGFYTHSDLPFYYSIAQTFALDDRYFATLPGPTVPNRMYLYAATSFGHLVTSTAEAIPPAGGYKPINGTILDLLNKQNVSWGEYVDASGVTELGIPYGALFQLPVPPHFQTVSDFMSQAASGNLPSVAFVDFSLGNSEHPPYDIRAGEALVAGIINAVRTGPNWNDSIIFWTYDEHGGFYDHVVPPSAVAPDNVPPGMCADASNPPGSESPGGGAQCSDSLTAEQALCELALPGESCITTFNQYGIRVPIVAISPFSKAAYVSHTVADHTSILALIEKRFLSSQHLTARDANANDLEDMFDFDGMPSLSATVNPALAPPASSSDPGCS
jgi:phospholipase C